MDSWRNFVLGGLCLLASFSSAIAQPFPWYCYPSDPVWSAAFRVSRDWPSRFYSPSELLDIYSDYVPSAFTNSLSDVFSWAASNGRVSLPSVCLVSSTYRLKYFASDYFSSLSNLIYRSISVVELSSVTNSRTLYPALVPAWYAMRYGFGGYESGGSHEFPYSSSPAFGNFFVPFSVTNVFNYPYGFTDWRSGTFLDSQAVVTNGDFYRSSSWFSGGYLGVVDAYFLFPVSPTMGMVEHGDYPVRCSDAYSALGDYFLPWYWQIQDGCVVWVDTDKLKILNVLRFSSPSNNYGL